MPLFLLFAFELSDEKETDNSQYYNIIKYKNNIYEIIVDEFNFNNQLFKF